jgi:hypothetical protein
VKQANGKVEKAKMNGANVLLIKRSAERRQKIRK